MASPLESVRTTALGTLVVAAVATVGSLYYSVGLGYYPCELCWYQRVAMYPLVVIFGYAAAVGMEDVHRLALPFSTVGLVLAVYHSWLQAAGTEACAFGGCAVVQYELAGVLSIPNQAAIAFALITATMAARWVTVRTS